MTTAIRAHTATPAPTPRARESSPLRLVRFLDEAVTLRRRGGRRSARPRMLTHTVTFRCNARCQMCDSWRLPEQSELELHEIERIYGELPPLDVVRLTGGEPFLRKDFAEIEGLATRIVEPRAVHITTNGFLTHRIVDLVERRDAHVPLHVLVSIDGTAEVHDEVRGVPRSYERALETVRELVERRRSHNLRVAVNQTVLDGAGARQYPALRDELARLGVGVHVIVAYRESATYSLERELERDVDGDSSYETFGTFDPGELEALVDQAERDLERLPRPERLAKRYYLAGLRRRLLGQPGPGAPPCVALHAHVRMFPNGDVPTCQNNSKVVGNLRASTFEEVWSSARAQEQRDWVTKCAGCWAECEVVPSAAYTGELAAFAARAPLESIKPARPAAAAAPPGVQRAASRRLRPRSTT